MWTQQTLAGDVSSAPGDPTAGPDADYSSSPALTVFPDGRRVLLAGQKSGVMHGIDPESGELLWKTRAGEGGILGGIEWGFATDGSAAYVALSNALEKKPGEAGGLVAINVLDGQMRWAVRPHEDTCASRTGCNTGQPAAVSAIPGVVFSGSLDGHLRAYDTEAGRVIWDIDTAREFTTVNSVPARGGSINGPGATIAGGMLFVSSGYSSLGFMPGNVLLALSLDGK
jgi:polyvinyl alcohol dehydrogenase (cytochrome)